MCVGNHTSPFRGRCRSCTWRSELVATETDAVFAGLDHTHPGWRQSPVIRSRPHEGKKQQQRWDNEVAGLYGDRPDGWPIITDRGTGGARAAPGRSPWGGTTSPNTHSHQPDEKGDLVNHPQAPDLVTADLPDTLAKVIPDGEQFVLWWTDRAANEWTETYSDLGIALTRLAVLHQCVSTNEGFAHTEPADFAAAAAAFLESAITHTTPAP